MDELEYITKDALMMCDQGAAPDYFKPTYNTTVQIHGCLVATNMDAAPLVNIPSFKVCKKAGGPCVPKTAPNTWKDTWQVKVKGIETLIGKCTCPCPVGGTIEFMTSGQVPLPADAAAEVKELQDQAQRELDDSGQGNSVGETGFVEGMIPVWGSGRDMINDIQTGDVGGTIMNAGFLVWDVASIVVGVFSFGTGTVAMQGIKAGVKGAVKTAAKAISKEALQQMGKQAFKKLSKEALKKSIDDVAKKLLKTCVFACFPAGTPVHTEHGLKNIEEIQVGDSVWAFDEETKQIALQEVVHTMQNETDHTISIYTEKEVIETTAQHPFYVNGAWKDASELQAGDKILTQQNETVEVLATKFSYLPKKVYNFEVAKWHTYFVGALMWLVHNAGKCLSELKNFDWGGYLKKLVGPPPPGMINPHAHHIVFKKGRGAMIKYLDKSKAVLDKHGIDWLKGKENLVWAPNKNHSTQVAKQVSEALEKADKLGGKEAVLKELDKIGKKFADDTIDTLF
jgi:Pretoxin HINT domain/Domain of unknown function (DUF4280)/A nuclease family of the HNH/ENDO VII superfamily with conserved AHH